MSANVSKIAKLSRSAEAAQRIWTAEVSRIGDDGRVFVFVDPAAGQEVRVGLLSGTVSVQELVPGATVLLIDPDDGMTPPILIGVVADKLNLEQSAGTGPRTEKIAARRVEVSAAEELRLDCGRSSVVLTKDGRIVLRGARITSRASDSNRIKGGTVQIN